MPNWFRTRPDVPLLMLGGISRALVIRLGWAGGSYGGVQFLRLLSNVALARLLSPQLFGLMLIVNSVRTGIELLSDVGITQNIVSNKRGGEPSFYNTAWTIQFIRGAILGAICIVFAQWFAEFFEAPELAAIFPVMAIALLFGGLQSSSRGLLEKRQQISRIAIADLAVAAVSLIAHVGLAVVMPSIWALVLGSLIASAATMIASYLLIPGLRHRLMIERGYAGEVFHFGKWIFASSVIYFAAMNFDRLYFAKQISLAELGVYSIARTLADMMSSFVVHAGNLLIFPAVAAIDASPQEIRAKVLRGRRTVLLIAAAALGSFVAFSDVVVDLLYDDRYGSAKVIVPILLLGSWFAVLCAVNEAILLGTGRPAYTAFGNASKLLTYIAAVPLAFHLYGFEVAVLVLSVGEVVRYLVLWALSRRAHLAFLRTDAVLTVVLTVAIVAVRTVLHMLGLTGDMTTLFPIITAEFWAT